MKRIKVGFKRLADAIILLVARTVLQNLTGNLFYVTPTPTLAVLQTAINDYDAALTAAKDRGKNSVAAKNARKEELADLLVQLSNYCMATNSTLEALVSTGFDLTKNRTPVPPVEAPVILKIENGINSGDIIVTIDAVKGRKAFLIEYTPDPITADSVWVSQNTCTCKTTITGLEVGKRYWIRVTVFGKGQQAATCEPVLTKVIQ